MNLSFRTDIGTGPTPPGLCSDMTPNVQTDWPGSPSEAVWVLCICIPQALETAPLCSTRK